MLTVLLIQIAFLIACIIVQQYPEAAEFVTRTFVRGYVDGVGRVNSSLGFSITEFSFFIVVISSVIFLAWGFCLLRLKNVWGFIHRVLMIILIIMGGVCMYNYTAGIEYHRQALPIEGYVGEIKEEEFKDIATYFVEDYNKCANELKFDEKGEIILPYSREHLVEAIRLEFDKLSDKYFHDFVPKAKPVTSSGLLTAVGIVGMYFSVLGEPNYSTYATNAELPFYIAHETAHGVGAMREDDAQILALFVCANSVDPLLRYSAYYNTIDRIINVLNYLDDQNVKKEVNSKIDEKIYKNYSYIYQHWKGKMFLRDFGDKINDWYLKTFGQKNGTSSYEDTEPQVDPGGKVISLSLYQKIYFEIYYKNNVSEG